MLIFSQKPNNPAGLFSLFETEPEKVLYFDIETTGLSADTSFIYLICAGFLKDGVPTLLQWFCEGPDDEVNVIRAFLTFAGDYSLLVHFNGATFDIPFVEKRARSYGLDALLEDSFGVCESIDLYKKIRPCRDLMNLSGCRQKCIESFMGIGREDKYNGGELIEIYKQYLGRSRYDRMMHGTPLTIRSDSGLPKMPETQSEALLYLLLLHNAEDVEGLIGISALYPIIQVIEGNAGIQMITGTELSEAHLIITFAPDIILPIPSFRGRIGCDSSFLLDFDGEYITVAIPVFTGELKFFFNDYKEYYYLPDEDCAIHKSAGAGVDKAHRKNATAATCYIKKSGSFLPFSIGQGVPEFKTDFKSKQTYVELSSFEKLSSERRCEVIMKSLQR